MTKDVHITRPTSFPILGSIAIFLIAVGLVNWLHGYLHGLHIVLGGILLLLLMMFLWFREVIRENRSELKGDVVLDRSMRWGMVWFIFTEVMFFAVFFGVLFYIRVFVLPFLSGVVEGYEATHHMLWPTFVSGWPVMSTPDPSQFPPPKEIIDAWGIPVVNTAILLLSGLTITLSHRALIYRKHTASILWLMLTIGLGWAFLGLQVFEYAHAYANGLTLGSGIYGNIFFLMTGFHGLHVFLGSMILLVIAYRMNRGHFSPSSHFAFEASTWYWHFVDVVWLGLFIFVYWL